MDLETGFHRIGLAIAVPSGVIATICAVGALAFYVAAPLGGSTFNALSREALSVSLATATIAVIWYAFWWTIGWIARGFSGRR